MMKVAHVGGTGLHCDDCSLYKQIVYDLHTNILIINNRTWTIFLESGSLSWMLSDRETCVQHICIVYRLRSGPCLRYSWNSKVTFSESYVNVLNITIGTSL